MPVHIYDYAMVSVVVLVADVYPQWNKCCEFQHIHKTHCSWCWLLVQLATDDYSSVRQLWNNSHYPNRLECLRRVMADLYNQCFRAFLPATVVVDHLRMLSNRSLLSKWNISKQQSAINLKFTRNAIFWWCTWDILIELRLLLSPDNDWVSMPTENFTPGLTKLVGRDRRLSRSTSERNGLFGVSWNEIEMCQAQFCKDCSVIATNVQ